VLDKLLVDAATEAGARDARGLHGGGALIEEDASSVSRTSQGGVTVTERAKVVVGADGRHSSSRTPSGLISTTKRLRPWPATTPTERARCGRFETYICRTRGFAAAATNDGLTLTVGGWPYAEFEANKKDVEATS
jgi:2-polyprenyl-6-methoxyphenol hydroxylase-like FAD-dependent oxidoreductase